MVKIRFSTFYFLLALGLLGIETVIGLQLHDALIRPYGGDFLVVILLYCLVRSLVRAPAWRVVLAVLLLAVVIEVSQAFHLIVRLGWQHSTLAQLVLGSGFAWLDLLAYLLGGLAVLALEQARPARSSWGPGEVGQ